MRLTVVQMNPGSDKGANLAAMRRLVGAAVEADRPGLVCLPEVWTCLGGDRAAKLAAAELLPEPGTDAPGGEAYEALRETARAHGVHLHGGSLGERAPGGGGERLFNTSVVFDPSGHEVARYRKVHLFDITAPDGTGYRESATYGGGEGPAAFDLPDGTRVGLSVCYDLRFPELYLELRRMGCEAILVPAAFTLQTGKDHWEALLRARAIETQCWVAAPATWGRHAEPRGERQTYGHSLICDPWGHVVARASDGPGHATARLDRALTGRVRRDMPLMEHRAARRWRPMPVDAGAEAAAAETAADPEPTPVAA